MNATGETVTTWNYRVVLDSHTLGDTTEESYTIREVYYEGDRICSWTEEPVGVVGDTWTECVDTLAIMGRAASQPIVDVRSGKPVETRRQRAQHG